MAAAFEVHLRLLAWEGCATNITETRYLLQSFLQARYENLSKLLNFEDLNSAKAYPHRECFNVVREAKTGVLTMS